MDFSKTKKIIVACCAIYVSTELAAAPKYYGILELGGSKSEANNLEVSIPASVASTVVIDDSDSSSYLGIGIGIDWEGKPLRSEIVYSSYGSQSFIDDTDFVIAISNERTTTKVKQESLMFNLLYDIDIDSEKFTPFIGAGIGVSKTRISATQVDNPLTSRSASFAEDSDTNFMWSLVAGVNYKVTERSTLGFGYRYTDAGNISTADNCISTGTGGSFICDTGEKHSADLTSQSLFINMNYYFQ